MELQKMKTGIARPLLLSRWWLRSRHVQPGLTPHGWTASQEFYVPLWAWPFELVHRAIFGRSKLNG